MIRKSCAIDTVLHSLLASAAVIVGSVFLSAASFGQEKAADSQVVAVAVSVPEPVSGDDAEVVYPRAVSKLGDGILVVDLNLPGIWLQEEGSRSLYAPGTKLLRKPINRPWAVVAHPGGGVLISDSATREIYACKEPGTELTALTGGYIGIPMALAVDPEGKRVYVGDAERRAVFRFPIEGGKPELVARVNARGLSFDSQGALWAVTPDAEAVQKIDVVKKSAEVVVGNRPYQFPNGLVWAGDKGYVTDSYGKAIWQFSSDGQTEKWLEGEPFSLPVGIAADDTFLYVADPQKKQVFRIDRESKKVDPML